MILMSKLAHSAAAQNMGKTIVGSLNLCCRGLAHITAFPFQTVGTCKFLFSLDWKSWRTRKHYVSVGEGDSKHYVWQIDDLETLLLVLERPPGTICISDSRGQL